MTRFFDSAKSCMNLAAAGRGLSLYRFAVCVLGLYLAFSSASLHAQSTPGSPATDLAAGVQLLRSGHAAEAKLKLNAAVAEASHSADALTWRGICENQLQQYSAAALDFQAALRLDGAMLAAHYNLALTFIRLRKTDAAIEQLRIVIAAQPDAVQPLYNLSVLLESKGGINEAMGILQTAHSLAPNDKGITLHLLMDSLKLKQTSQLATLLGELADNSVEPEIERQAGSALIEAGRFSDAVDLLKLARDREPNAPGIDLFLARALIGDHQDAEAIALLSAARLTTAESEERIYLLALAYLETGAISDASANFEAAAKLDPKDARPLFQLALIAQGTNKGPAEAVPLLRMAHTLEPDNREYLLALARALLVNDRAEEAKGLLEKATANDERPELHVLRGVAFAATHEVAQAISQLSKALEEDPTLALAQNVLGFCYLQQGKYTEAASAYGKASDLDPRHALYARDAALAFERANQPGQAMHFAERANALDGANAQDHELLGKLYASSDQNQDAVRELLRAAELDPDLDSAVYLLARTYQRLGDRQQAAEWSAKLSALKQKHEAAFKLQKIAAAEAIRSSKLLEGGSSTDVEAGIP